ncbi:hypothetical protein [Gordonia sp. NPDC003585]|uniref:hypothetical protein n=1 Tax=unclassified Gordonia (in: high G+C Gram-positive bacteria) TaxID=2657482 RepID=UPI0033B37990
MTIAYWIAAVLLGAFFAYAGALELLRTREQLGPGAVRSDTAGHRHADIRI